MKKLWSMMLCGCLVLSLAGCGNTGNDTQDVDTTETQSIVEETQETAADDTAYTMVNTNALGGTEYDGYAVEVLSYSFDDEWRNYEDEDAVNAVCIRFYYENGNEEPYYLLESFGITPYQDGVELEYISLNSDNEEAQNTIQSVKDGASVYCLMVFELISDSDVELRITEPTANADLLLELTLTK